MTMKSLLFSASVLILAPFAAAQDPELQSELQDIRERLDEIEELQMETSEKVGGRAILQAYTAEAFDFGGHVTSLFSHIEGEANSETGHLVSLVELFLKGRLNDEWSVFAAPGFYTFNGGLLDNPATPTVAGDPVYTADTQAIENLFVSRIYGQWAPSDLFQVQGGVIGSPHGTTNREYFIPARTIAAGNLHTRVFLSNQLYPQVVRGVKASGKRTVGEEDWIEYDVYFGTDESNAADALGGARVGYRFGAAGLTVAANYGQGTRFASASPTTNFGVLQSPFAADYNLERDYRFGGVDVDWRTGPFIFKGEAYYSAEDGVTDQRALSAEATYFVTPEWGVSYRYDFYDRGADMNVFAPGMPVLDLGHSTEHVVGVTYNPHPSVRLRLDLHHNNLPNTSDTVQFANLSWSLSF